MQYIITRMKTHTIRHLALGLFTAFSASGCDMFEYHPYSTKFEGRTNIHAENIEQIERLCKDKEEITFAFITDTQGSNTAMKDAIRLICERGDIDFIVHGGDQTDFGLPKEFMWCRDLMDSSGLPYVSVIGNHDCPLDKTSPLRRFAQKRREDNSFLFIYGHYSMNVEFSTK